MRSAHEPAEFYGTMGQGSEEQTDMDGKREMKRFKPARNTLLFLLFLALSAAFLSVYAKTTTPFLKSTWDDSAFFILVGQGMTRGLLPYRDFFDMKGPYLFFLEYIGQMIRYGKTGAFVIECVNLAVCLYIVSKLLDLYGEGHRHLLLFKIVSLLGCGVIAAITFQGGNMTEELCLPLILASVYLCLKYFRQVEKTGTVEHPARYAFFHGFAVGVIVFIRITNAATIGAVLLTILMYLLVQRKLKNIGLNILMCFSGFLLAVLPPCLFFAFHGLLREMLNQVFLFGFAYSAETGMVKKAVLLLASYKKVLSLLLTPFFACLIYGEKKWYYWTLALFSAGLVFLACAMGNAHLAYLHYFTLILPNIVMGFAFLLKNSGERIGMTRFWICAACFAALFLLQRGDIRNTVVSDGIRTLRVALGRSEDPDSEALQRIQETASRIPATERDRVFAFGSEHWSNWYIQTGMLPCNRYCDWQVHYLKLIPDMEEELVRWIGNGNALWIVTTAKKKLPSEKVEAAVLDHFSEYFKNEKYILYRRNG